MLKLQPHRAGQEIWEHEGKKYSVVDLTAWPEFIKPPDDGMVQRFESMMKMTYPVNPVEVALVSKGGGVEILGRFESFQLARAAIEDGNFDDDFTF